MDLLKSLLEAHGGDALKQVASQVGLNTGQAASAVSELLPSLAKGMQANITKPGGLESLLGAVKSGNHQRYIDNPAELTNAVPEGNGILGHLLGSKEVSRQVAAQAAQKTGIDTEKLKSMLPLIATMMMGTVGKKLSGATAPAGAGAQPSMAGAAAALQNLGGSDAIGSILGQFLGGNQPAGQQQQRPAGGLLNLARKFFK